MRPILRIITLSVAAFCVMGCAQDPSDASDTESSAISNVTIVPNPAHNDDTVSCSANIASLGDQVVAVTYTWSVDSQVLGEGPTLDLAETPIQPGDTLACTATASITGLEPASREATITIANRVPRLHGVDVSPQSADLGEVVVCRADASDPDGDPLDLAYLWSNGVTDASFIIDNDNASPGASITCTVTVTDPQGASDTMVSTQSIRVEDSVTVVNSPPSLTSVSISPTSGRVGDTLTCAATATDPDGEAVAFTYAWSTGDTGPDLTLTVDNTTVGATLTCTATVTDPHGDTDIALATATVLNSVPSAPAIGLTPSNLLPGNDLTCAIVTPSVDPDGDPISYTFEWTLDGAPFDDVVSTNTTSVVSGHTIASGQSWTCIVTPHDGRESGPSVSVSSTVEHMDCEDGEREYGVEPCGYLSENREVMLCVEGKWQPVGCGSTLLSFESTVTHVYDAGELPAGVAVDDTFVFTASVPHAVTLTDDVSRFECDGDDTIVDCYDQAWHAPGGTFSVEYSGGHREMGTFDYVQIRDGGAWCETYEDPFTGDEDPYCSPEWDVIAFLDGTRLITYADDFSGHWIDGPIPTDLGAMLDHATLPNTFYRTMFLLHHARTWSTYNYDYLRTPNRTVVTRRPADCEVGMKQPGDSPCASGVLLQGCEAGQWVDLDTCVER